LAVMRSRLEEIDVCVALEVSLAERSRRKDGHATKHWPMKMYTCCAEAPSIDETKKTSSLRDLSSPWLRLSYSHTLRHGPVIIKLADRGREEEPRASGDRKEKRVKGHKA